MVSKAPLKVSKGKKKKSYSKTGKKYSNQNVVYGGAPGVSRLIPKRKYIKCGYEFTQILTKANNVNLAMVHVRLNAIYDPEYDNGGKNLPVNGYTQISGLYGTYKVIGGTIMVQAENNSSVPIPFAVAFQNDVTSTTTAMRVTDVATRQGGKLKLLGYLDRANQTITSKFDVKKQYGINKYTFSDSLFGASMGNTPTNKMYAVIALGEVGDGATVQTSIVIRVRVIMNTLLFDPIENITSS